MRKQALLLMAGGILAFASCNTETTSTTSDAQVDSMVNARVEEIRLEMMRQNDSLINAMAQIKADSIIAAMKGGKSVTTKTTTTRTTTVKPGGGTQTTTTKTPSVNDRPGATNTGGAKNVNDRPGATNTTGSKSVKERPGATNTPK